MRVAICAENCIMKYNGPINLHTKYAKLRGKY